MELSGIGIDKMELTPCLVVILDFFDLITCLADAVIIKKCMSLDDDDDD